MGAMIPAIMSGICWAGWIIIMILEIVYLTNPTIKLNGIYSLAWVLYLGFVTVVTAARVNIRNHYGIHGNPIEDFFAVLFMYPSVMVQLELVSEKGGLGPLMPDNRNPELSEFTNGKNHDLKNEAAV